MATAAQIEANRRNSSRSTGPRTQKGKDRSKLNALVHGCRAEILVLPTEDPDLFEDRSRTWRLSLKPRNPAEEYMVTGWRAWRGRGSGSIGPRWPSSTNASTMRESTPSTPNKSRSSRWASGCWGASPSPMTNARGPKSYDADNPMHLVLRLQTTVAGCQWMLDQWASLRTVLERDVPWLAADQRKAVRLLGHNPVDVLDNIDVARLYLASHVLLESRGRAVSGHHR